MKPIVGIWLLAAISSGCVAPQVLVKPGAGQQEFERDRYECKIQTERGPYAMAYARDPLGNLHYLTQVQNEMVECMKYKGW